MICTAQQILQQSNQEWDGQGLWHVWGDVHTWFWWGQLKDNLKHFGIGGRRILKLILTKQDGRAGTVLVWLITTSGGLLWTWEWTCGLYKTWWISQVTEEPVAFQAGLCSIELISRLVDISSQWPDLKNYPGICQVGLKKTTSRQLICVPVKIWILYLQIQVQSIAAWASLLGRSYAVFGKISEIRISKWCCKLAACPE